MHGVPRREAKCDERYVCCHIGCSHTDPLAMIQGGRSAASFEKDDEGEDNAGFDTVVRGKGGREVTSVV